MFYNLEHMKKIILSVLAVGLFFSPVLAKAQMSDGGSMMVANVQSALEAIRLKKEAGQKPMMTETKPALDEKTRARVKEIMEQIAKLQTELRGLMGNNGTGYLAIDPVYPMPMACRMIERDLKLGDRGEDVKTLREALKAKLAESGDTTVTVDAGSDVFDTKLEAVVKHLQEKQLGLAAGQAPGNTGPKTRAWLNARCGKPLPINAAVSTSVGATAGQ